MEASLMSVGPKPFDQIADGLDAITINPDSGERKLDEHKIKIVAVERRAVGYFGDRVIQHGPGDGSRQISMFFNG
jgi:hypothetical protein